MWRIRGPSFKFKREHRVPRCCQPPRRSGREVCTPKGRAALKSQVSRLKCEGRRSTWGGLRTVPIVRLRPGFSRLSFDPSLCIGRTWSYHGPFKGRSGILLRPTFIVSPSQVAFTWVWRRHLQQKRNFPTSVWSASSSARPCNVFPPGLTRSLVPGKNVHVQAQEQSLNLVND